MPCNCQSTTEAALLARFKETQPTWTDHKAELDGYAFVLIGSRMEMRAAQPLVFTGKATDRKGVVRAKKLKQRMIATYCPFCGVPYDEKLVKEPPGFAVSGTPCECRDQHVVCDCLPYELKAGGQTVGFFNTKDAAEHARAVLTSLLGVQQARGGV